MPYTQLIYISRLAPTVSSEDLSLIVARSGRNNARRDITGVLLCCGRDVMQLLEGDEMKVREVFEPIGQDERHSRIELLLAKTVNRRLFPEWAMGLADLRSRTLINRDRLVRMIQDLRAEHDTKQFGVEARMLIHDFSQQLLHAA